MSDPRKIVTLGGGTGHYALLRALKLIPNVAITAVVSVADSGGSSGELRDTHGVLPPGDLLKAVLALSEMDPTLVREFLLHRFDEGRFKDHTIGNLLIASHASHTGNMLSAVSALSRMVCVEHVVLPVTFAKIKINAHYSDGIVRRGEANIDAYHGEAMIESLSIEPESAYVCGPAKSALMDADVIIVAPGSLYTSLLPVMMVSGMADLLQQSQAPKVFVCNTMTQNGDTRGYCVHDFIAQIEKALGCSLDHVLVDSSTPDADVLERYAQQNQFPVQCRVDCPKDGPLIGAPLSTEGELVRHDYQKLSRSLRTVLKRMTATPVTRLELTGTATPN